MNRDFRVNFERMHEGIHPEVAPGDPVVRGCRFTDPDLLREVVTTWPETGVELGEHPKLGIITRDEWLALLEDRDLVDGLRRIDDLDLRLPGLPQDARSLEAVRNGLWQDTVAEAVRGLRAKSSPSALPRAA